MSTLTQTNKQPIKSNRELINLHAQLNQEFEKFNECLEISENLHDEEKCEIITNIRHLNCKIQSMTSFGKHKKSAIKEAK